MEFIIRYGEIFLKGKNRHRFEKRLINNIHDYLKKNNIKGKILKNRNRLILNTNKNVNLKRVFGIVSYSSCFSCKAELSDIKKTVLKIIKEKKLNKDKKFRVTSKNTDKSIPLGSMELNREIGAFIVEKTNAKVDLENYEVEIGIDIIDEKAYVFTESISCFGGLPVGVEGMVLSLIEDEKSVLAALLTMKRGCKIVSLMLNEVNIDLLKNYAYGFKLKQIKIKNISEIGSLAEKYNSPVLVAGQTLRCFKELNIKLPVFRPLIGFNKKEIKEKIKDFER